MVEAENYEPAKKKKEKEKKGDGKGKGERTLVSKCHLHFPCLLQFVNRTPGNARA